MAMAQKQILHEPVSFGERTRFESRSNDVTVVVEPIFLESHSFPALNHYVWAYKVAICNERTDALKLTHRYWLITDSKGNSQEVSGEGVVGQQPVIQAGCRYEYTSGAPLRTPSGVMAGRYRMENPDGSLVDVEIPTFSLDSPFEKTRFN
ncbi:MAG: Co2+/Mg2+ efflux protein ApaG [Neomegalonema sp.]|nr:Co2+/Mg2+ efflux protein ApaG [Neomegalonema sp.]